MHEHLVVDPTTPDLLVASDKSRSWACVLRQILDLAQHADEGRVPF